MNISRTSSLSPQATRPFRSEDSHSTDTSSITDEDQEQVDINWSSIGRTAALSTSFVAVPAAMTLAGKALDQPLLGFAGAVGGGLVAFALRPKQGSLMVGSALSSLGFHGANTFGLGGALGAAVFGAGLGALADYQAQSSGTKIF